MVQGVTRLAVAVVCVAVVCSCVAHKAVTSGSGSGVDDPAAPAGSPALPSTDQPTLSIEPAVVDLGVVSQCVSPDPIRVKLRNNLAEPLRIAGFVSTCGCTVPDVEPNVEIAPGAELVVNIRLEMWGRGRKQQFIRFVGAHAVPLGRVQILYEVDSSLRTIPSGISRDLNPDGSIDLESTDEAPFQVTGADPAVVTFNPDQVATDHAGTIAWEKIDQLASTDPGHPGLTLDKSGRWAAALIRIGTSKGDCPGLFVWVKNSRAPKAPAP